MESPNRKYSPQVDELRGIAAVLVVLYHVFHLNKALVGMPAWPVTTSGLSALIFEGHTGVALFMVLSGYILAKGTLDGPIHYGQFFKNRVLRIFPLMVTVIVFGIYGSKATSLSGVLAPFLFMQNLPFAFSDTTHLSGAIWTISVEFQFYLVAPFLFLFTARKGLMGFLVPFGILIFILKAIIVLQNGGDGDKLVNVTYFTIVGRFSQFLFGIALAHLTRDGRTLPHGWLMLAGGGLGILVLLTVLNRQGGLMVWHSWRLLYPDLEGFLWAVFIAGYVQVRPFGTGRLSAAGTAIGKRSFSLYVLHWPMMYALHAFNARYGIVLPADLYLSYGLRLLELVLPLALVVGLSFSCIESPFLGLRGKYVKPSRPASHPHHRP